MTASPKMIEREALDEMERRLIERGYVMQREPAAAALPAFLGRFRPDAIATGKTPNLLIEVIAQRGPHAVDATKIKQLQQLLKDQPEWRLEVVYARSGAPGPTTASIEAIRRRFDDVRRLAVADLPAALVVGWSLLEALARILEPKHADRALDAATAVELLASLGYVDPSAAASLRAAGRVRNLVAHGDVSIVVDGEDVENLLDSVGDLIRRVERRKVKAGATAALS
jgi:uncharacterized protein YutE (UPF0331/DUF86 family)